MWFHLRVDERLRARVENFLRPLYQDLDGISRFVEVERIATIARALHEPDPADEVPFELLLLFHRLGKWLERVGNLSRASLATGLSEGELRRIAASIPRIGQPLTNAERAIAAAILIDECGVRGLAERFAHARREGHSVIEVACEELAGREAPEWMPEKARRWFEERAAQRLAFCRALLAETDV